MRKRAFVFSKEKFPRGSAGANYIQYFAKALMTQEFEVIVIGKISDPCLFLHKQSYKGIEYIGLSDSDPNNQLYYSKSDFDYICDSYKITEEDYFIFYNFNIRWIRYFKRRFGTNHIFVIRVEEMQFYQYKYGAINPKYIMSQHWIRYSQKNSNGIFAISSSIAETQRKYGCRVMILPIMADPSEYEFNIEKKKGDIIEFIYPGLKTNPYEDDLATTFQAIAQLPKEDRERIRLHITGVDKDKLNRILPRELRSIIEPLIVAHGFIKYDELIALYQMSDYLLLFRKENKVTKANFPSKIPEVMAFGVIPICTDVGDYTRLYLDSTNSIQTRPGDASECASAIHEAIHKEQDNYLNMRKKARELVVNRFSYKVWAAEIVSFIEEVK